MVSNINPAGFPSEGLPNEGYRLWLALVILIIISGTVVIARIATRVSNGQLGADDYVIVAALASCLIQTTLWAISVRTGYGAAYLLLDDWYRREFNKWWFFGSIFYPITLTLFKSAVILLNKRIFIQRWFQILCWCTLTVVCCWGLGNTLGTIFQCLPVSSMWGAVPAETCFNMDGHWISLVTWDVSTDVFILAMVIPLIWQLQLKVRDKAMLTGVFMLGAMVIVFSILSCSAISDGMQREGDEDNKLTYALANLFQVLESNFGIICACLPVLRIPLKQFLPKIFGSTRRASHAYYTDDSFERQYVMQSISNKDKSWRDVSVSANGKLKSSGRRVSEDELGIITESTEPARLDAPDRGSGATSPFSQHAIRKKVKISVDLK